MANLLKRLVKREEEPAFRVVSVSDSQEEARSEAERRIRHSAETKDPELDLHSLGLTEWPESLAELTHLRRLTAMAILTLGNPYRTLPPWIGRLENIEELYVGFNALRSVPDTIRYMKKLRKLSLGANCLTQLPDVFAGLASLEELDVADNDLQSLPASLGEAPALRRLDLHNNPGLCLQRGMTGGPFTPPGTTAQAILDHYFRA